MFDAFARTDPDLQGWLEARRRVALNLARAASQSDLDLHGPVEVAERLYERFHVPLPQLDFARKDQSIQQSGLARPGQLGVEILIPFQGLEETLRHRPARYRDWTPPRIRLTHAAGQTMAVLSYRFALATATAGEIRTTVAADLDGLACHLQAAREQIDPFNRILEDAIPETLFSRQTATDQLARLKEELRDL